MLFNSINYFIFLFVVVVLNYVLPHRFRWLLILVVSIVFYGIGGLSTIAVPIVIILTTFYCVKLIERTSSDSRKKLFFFIGLFVTLGLLIFYKYINFFLGLAFDVTNLFAKFLPLNLPTHSTSLFLNLVIPLGISYIAFQAIGYLIEIKRGNHSAESHLGYFATYMFFFPKLLSGPIERAHNFLPQFNQEHKFDYTLFVLGLKRIVWGLFLKLVIANRLALYSDGVFVNSNQHTGISLLVAAVFFTVQLFTDFAGYTSMAIGSAQLLGYKLMENFNYPFIATSVTEFWRRWHISLTTWVNDYIYNPIVINRRDWNKWAVVYAGMLTFIILGFWHGASWNYIIFGFLQGLILAIEFLSRKLRKKLRYHLPSWINNSFGVLYVFSFFCLSTIFFKVQTVNESLSILKKILSLNGPLFVDLINMIYSFFGIVFLIFIHYFVGTKGRRIKDMYFMFSFNSWIKEMIFYIVLIVLILYIGVFDGSQFIYFQF